MILTIPHIPVYQRHFTRRLIDKLVQEHSCINYHAPRYSKDTKVGREYLGWVSAFNQLYNYLKSNPEEVVHFNMDNLSPFHKDLLYSLIFRIISEYDQWVIHDINIEDEPDIELLALRKILKDIDKSLRQFQMDNKLSLIGGITK